MPKKRETIEPKPGDKRFVRRDKEGHFTEDQTDVGRSLEQDRERRAREKSEPGEGDRGDRDQSGSSRR